MSQVDSPSSSTTGARSAYSLTILFVVATVAMLALYGSSIGWGSLLFVATFLTVHVLGWKHKSWRGSPDMQRLTV
ncbi:MAG: hypothetical protein V3R80_13050, partial [Candidatus Tectomicrobia bacterium]